MEILFLIIMAITILIAWRIWNAWTWKTLMIATDSHSQEIIRQKFESLVDQGLRCKIKSEIQTNSSISATEGLMSGSMQPSSSLTKLLVHRKDLEIAKEQL